MSSPWSSSGEERSKSAGAEQPESQICCRSFTVSGEVGRGGRSARMHSSSSHINVIFCMDLCPDLSFFSQSRTGAKKTSSSSRHKSANIFSSAREATTTEQESGLLFPFLHAKGACRSFTSFHRDCPISVRQQPPNLLTRISEWLQQIPTV